MPIALGFFAIGTAKWPKMGPWDIGIPLYRLFAVLSVLGMGLIIYIAVQPPNDKVLWITLAFLVITAIIWVLFENKRFQGPPIGEHDQEAPGRDPGGGEGRRRDLTLAKVA